MVRSVFVPGGDGRSRINRINRRLRLKRNGKMKMEAAVGGLWRGRGGPARDGKMVVVTMVVVMILMIMITITHQNIIITAVTVIAGATLLSLLSLLLLPRRERTMAVLLECFSGNYAFREVGGKRQGVGGRKV